MRFTIGFAKQVWAGLLVLLALTVVLGVVYPAARSLMASPAALQAMGDEMRERRRQQAGAVAVLLAEVSGGDPFDESLSRTWPELQAELGDEFGA